MRVRGWLTIASCVVLTATTLTVQGQTPPARDTGAYKARCAACHGADLSGAAGAGPAILTYVRYHTNAEVMARLREAHTGAKALSLSDDELKNVLADLRALTGTDPMMATGGFTGTGR